MYVIKVILLLGVINGLNNIRQIKENPHILIVDKSYNNHEVTINVRDTLILKFEAQSGTGYIWNLVKSNQYLALISKGQSEQRNDQLIGGIEHYIIRMVAIHSGNCLLEFKYERPWKRNEVNSKSFRLKVKVRKE